MTTINDIQDLVQIIKDRPEWRRELQSALLTPDLRDTASLITETAKLVTKNAESIEKIETTIAETAKAGRQERRVHRSERRVHRQVGYIYKTADRYGRNSLWTHR